MSKKVWFSLPEEYSPELGKPVSHLSQEFAELQDCSDQTQDSALSQFSLRSSVSSQISFLSQHSLSSQSLSQYSVRSSMDPNSTTETYSASESQEISSSQQDSTDGQYGFDDANSTSSMQDEALHSAIMEVSGELMLGNLAPHKHQSGGSESSDISDDEARRAAAGGSIAKYPESSTGMSDNDWNPYATESDTNQTPRSPRSNTSDDNRVGFVSRATINVGPPQDKKKEILTTGQALVGQNRDADRVVQQNGQWQISNRTGESSLVDRDDLSSQRLEMLRFLVDREAKDLSPRTADDRTLDPNVVRSPEPEDGGTLLGIRDRHEPFGDEDERESRESPETVKSVHSEETLSGRQSIESRKSDEAVRESFESDKGSFERKSGDFEQEFDSRRQSGESGRSRQSVESWKSGGSARSELEKSGDSNLSGRQSTGSHLSQRSEQSENSQRSTGRSSDRSERLDRLNEAAGTGIKEVIEFENAQRIYSDRDEHGTAGRVSRDSSGSPVTRMRLTAKLQPYGGPHAVKSPQDVQNLVGKTGYVSIAERQRLLDESPEPVTQTRSLNIPRLELERSRPVHSSANLPKFSEVERSPSDVSMKRVSSLFEETKQAARAAVALPRPDPSGSEERFPLRDRMDHSIHEDSLMAQEQRRSFEMHHAKPATRQRESEVSRSLNSEEVARVLGRYTEGEDTGKRSAPRVEENSAVTGSAFNRIGDLGEVDNSYASASSRDTANSAASQRTDEMSDDEIARRVRAILSETDRIGHTGGNGKKFPTGDGLRKTDYVPGTMDYTRLQRDLEEIQDSLHDVPVPKANDSLHLMARDRYEPGQKRPTMSDEEYKSLESTSTTVRGRESGASEVGQRLVWDHGADLEYDDDYDGKFLGTMTTSATGTLSSRLKYGTSNSDDMLVRPISSASNDTERDVPDLESTGTRTLTGTDISRAEKLVQQVLNRQAEGDLKENVEDIIARYRNERKDMYDRLQTEPETQSVPRMTSPPEIPGSLKKPELYLQTSAGEKTEQTGLAERVFKILTNGKEDDDHANPENKGMAKEVYSILTKEPPHQQVNGILTQTTAEENEMLKKMVSRPKDESSSMDDSGLNESGDSFHIEDKDIRKQLEWSQFSSPDKTGMSDLAAIRKVTSAPYSSVSNVKSLLSSQLQKVTQRNFDKSVELRTPYRQNIACYPVYGVDLDRNRDLARDRQREAWRSNDQPANRPEPLSSERFFLTDRDRGQYHSEDQRARHRTHSDPFDVSPSRRAATTYRDGHSRSKSEEATSPSDLSQYSFVDLPSSPVDRQKSDKPVGSTPGVLVTPKQHRPHAQANALRASVQSATSTTINKTTDWCYECYTSDSTTEPCCHSDSSDGNLWHYHGYQRYSNTRVNPPRDLDTFAHPRTKHLSVQSSNLSIEGVTDDDSPCCGDNDEIHSPLKKQRAERQSRARAKHNPPKGKKLSSPMSKSLPARRNVTGQAHVLQSPISRDDVYELLCRSQKQEEKLHELRSRLLQHELGCSQPTLGQSTISADDLGNYGDTRTKPRKTSFHEWQQGRRPGYSRRDGSPSPTESDTSSSKRGSRLRPYRPAGSRDMYYTESGDDTNESGTTIESTHPGSDDAIPPYIPRQFLGSREDEPVKHPTGIYGRKDKDDLSTIDETSAKDEKEKALSVSGSSNKSSRSNPAKPADGRRSPSVRSNPDSGLGSTALPHDLRDPRESDLSNLATTRSRSPYSQRDNPSNGSSENYTRDPKEKREETIERPGFKTREEFQREFEARERELKEHLARLHRRENKEKDPLATSVRSDPGEALANTGNHWEFRESAGASEFQELKPEPVYPQERLRYSRSRSDTDLVSLSPAESQKYSSPMQPGTRFMELSTHPSPIFSHHDSITYHPMRRGEVPPDLPRVPADLPRVPADLPKAPVEKEQRFAEPRELPRVDDRSKVPPKAISTDENARFLEPSSDPAQPLEPVELGADPRRMGGVRRAAEERPVSERPKSPLHSRQKDMERELERLNRELTEQVIEIQSNKSPEPEKEFEDNFPPSKKAQVLREVLEQEYQDNVPPNINDMWLRFKEQKEQSMSESSLNSTRLDALSGLLDNPTKHTVTSAAKEKSKSIDSRSAEGQVNSDKAAEEPRRRRRMSDEEAVEERSQKRQELKQRSGLSEEESNGSYTELLIEKERKKVTNRGRRGVRQEERSEKVSKENRAPDMARGVSKSSKNVAKDRPNDKAVVTDIRSRNLISTQHSDTMDTLFSIPEDASFEQSPTKAESDLKSRQKRHRHVIDPLMKKLRDKIKLQRDKIDKERRKELQRMEKLKRLQMLLNAKRGGKLSDKAIHVELENVSTTSSFTQSESSHLLSDTTLTAPSSAGDSEVSSQESTTLIDSTVDSIKLQPKKYPVEDFSRPRKQVFESDSTDTSDFSNIIVERVQSHKPTKVERKSSSKKGSGKTKKTKFDEDGNRIKKEKKKKKDKGVFGVELTEEDLDKQLKRYQRQMSPDGRRQHSAPSPERKRVSSPERRRVASHALSPERRRVVSHASSPDRRRLMQDACTMYPSPITVSPPSRRRIRDVLMRSEAIQTSPSIRSSSPTYSYDEVPVAPVPTMSSTRTTRRRPSPSSPPRQSSSSSPVLQRKTSKSPLRSAKTIPRQFSKSPPRRKTSRSPSEKTRQSGPFIPRKTDESMWKVETELPPANSMFTPESPVSGMDFQDKPGQAWFVPMQPSKPWQKPQKERHAFAVRQEAWQPTSVSQSTWKNIVHGDILKDKEDPNDISRDTKFDLDPDGQPIRDENDVSDSEESDDEDKSKPLSKMSLQEAFLAHRQTVVSRVRERQKRLNLAAEERKMQVFLEQERDKLFQEERKKEANPEAHPYSDNLHKPARRVISKEEMKEITQKKYKKLPEVLEKQKLKKRSENYSLNRLKARLYNRRIQKRVLQKAETWGR